MKRISIVYTIILVALMSAGAPVFAVEATIPDPAEQKVQQKDECLLVAKNCGTSILSIQDKIEKLKEEIAKGRAVYTTEELNNLKQKLDDVSRTLDFLLER